MKIRIDVIDLRTGKEVLSRTLEDAVVTIGRDASRDLFIPDEQQPELSRKHAWIERRADGYHVFDGDKDGDRRSQNGTALNGRRLEFGRGELLNEGDVIVLGNRFRLHCHRIEEAPPAPPPAQDAADRTAEIAVDPVTREVAPPPRCTDSGALAVAVAGRLRVSFRAWSTLPRADRGAALHAAVGAELDALALDPTERRAVLAELAALGPVPRVASEPEPADADGLEGFAQRLLGRPPRPEESDAEVSERAALVLIEFMDSFHRSIRSRRDFQQEVDPEATQQLRLDPNLLMNARNLDEVRGMLFDPARSDEAVRKLLHDALLRMELHLLGVVAMYERAPRATLATVHPDQIEKQAQGAFAFQPLRGMKCWENYRQTVEEFHSNPARLFHAVWPELIKVYLKEHEKHSAASRGSGSS